MPSSDDVTRIYVQIVNGVNKADSTIPLDEELSALWDKISKEVAEAKAKDYLFDIPNDFPSVDPVDPALRLRVAKPIDTSDGGNSRAGR